MELLTLSIDFLTGNLMAILLCVIANMVIGMIWYGPLFGKKWAAMNNLPMPKKGEVKFSQMAEPMVTSMVGAAVQSAILAGLFMFLIPTSMIEAMMIATVLWLGFIATTVLSNYAWAAKPMALRLIDTFFALVTINVFAGILFFMS